MIIELIKPSLEYLPGYVGALERGWSPDNLRPEKGKEELKEIQDNPQAFFVKCDNPKGGQPITLPDGSTVPCLPGFKRWIWDGEFCGDIGFRCQPGTPELPPTCLGHIGYSVVPWKQRHGYATQALKLLLPELKAFNLPYVEITTEPENFASQKVITANSGALIERFQKPAAYGVKYGLRYRINL